MASSSKRRGRKTKFKMSGFDSKDMQSFIESLGTMIVVKDVNKEHEHHFVASIRKDIRKEGPVSLVTRYAPLVTLIDRCDKLSETVQSEIIDLVVESLKVVTELVGDQNFTEIDEEDFKYYQQIVAVVIYLAYKCLEEYNFFSGVHNATMGEKADKRKKKAPDTLSKRPFGFWVRGRDRLLEALAPLLHKTLHPLWATIKKPNGKTFYGLILTGLVSTVRYGAADINRDDFLSNTILELLNHFIVNHGFEDDVVLFLMRNILDSDEVSQAITKIVIGLQSNYCHTSIIRKSVQIAFDLITQPENYEKVDRGFTSFLLSIGTNFPEEIREHSLPFVVSQIDAESVPLRTAVLCVLVEVISQNMETISEATNPFEKNQEFREKLLSHVFDYMRDSHATVRTKAIVSLARLIGTKAMKLQECPRFVYEVGKRVLDSSQSVRRACFGILEAVVINEPFLAKHKPEEFRARALEKRKELVEKRTANIDDLGARLRLIVQEFTDQLRTTKIGFVLENRPLIPELQDPDEALDYIKCLLDKGAFWEACECFYKCVTYYQDMDEFQAFDIHSADVYRTFFMKELGLISTDEVPDEYETDMLETREVIRCRSFLTHVNTCETLSDFLYSKIVPILLKLFRHGKPTDQSDVMDYLATLATNEFPLPPEVPLTILECISRVDRQATAGIIEPFSVIFFSATEAMEPIGLIKTLVTLVEQLGVEQWGHMDLIIQEMVIAKMIHIPALKILWDMFLIKVDGFGAFHAKIALYVLGICAKAQRNVLSSLIGEIIEIGLGPRGCNDLELAKYALAAVYEFQKKNENGQKLEPDHILFQRITDVIRHALVPETRDLVVDHFRGLVDLAMALIYECCLKPNVAIQPILQGSYVWIFGGPEDDELTELEMDENLLFKFLSLAGALTGSHSSYHAHWVLNEVKRRLTISAIEERPSGSGVKNRLQKSLAELSKRKSVGTVTFSDTVDDQILKADEEELAAVVGQVGFDKETEMVRNYMDRLLEEGVFRFYWQSILYVCRRYTKYKSLRVRIAALRLFGKIMLVGQKALDGGLDLYLELWEKVVTPEEKVELIMTSILLNDCYPNQMSRVNAIVIQGLKAKSAEVRQATLDFVTYLTLNDTLKLREILPDTICCLGDNVFEIREVTMNFLKHCQEKDTMLHSSIPDMIIRLSSRTDLPADKFQEIMQRLLSSIKKVNESAGIALKLLERFHGSHLQRGRPAQDNALCLSLLNHNDKVFKLVREHLVHYSRYLDDSIVYDSFISILKHAKDNCKPEARSKLEDYENELQEGREKAVELRRMDLDIEKGLNTTPEHRRPADSESSDIGRGASSSDEEAGSRPAQKSTRTTRNSQLPKPTAPVSDDEDDDFVPVHKPNVSKSSRRPKPASKKAPVSIEDEDEEDFTPAQLSNRFRSAPRQPSANARVSDDDSSEEPVQLTSRTTRSSRQPIPIRKAKDTTPVSEDEDDSLEDEPLPVPHASRATRTSRQPMPVPKAKLKVTAPISEDEASDVVNESSEEEEEEERVQHPSRATRSSRQPMPIRKAKVTTPVSEDEDEPPEDEPVPVPRARRATRTSRQPVPVSKANLKVTTPIAEDEASDVVNESSEEEERVQHTSRSIRSSRQRIAKAKVTTPVSEDEDDDVVNETSEEEEVVPVQRPSRATTRTTSSRQPKPKAKPPVSEDEEDCPSEDNDMDVSSGSS